MLTFPDQKIIKSAVILFRIGSAESRAMLINGAASLLPVEEAADALVDGIFPVAKYPVAISADKFGEATLSDFISQIESLREPRDIPLCYQNPFIGAAVSRTFRAVIARADLFNRQNGKRFFRHYRLIDHYASRRS